MPPPSAAIVIVRAPLDAILSFFTLKTARVKLGGDFHKEQLPKSIYKTGKFKKFAKMAARKWRRHMEKLNSDEPLGRFAGPIPVLLVHYEELVNNLDVALYKMFTFIHDEKYLNLGDKMPEVSDALMCSLRHYAGKEHRSHKKVFNPFTPDLISHICNQTKLWYNEKLWGRCEDGLLQKQREIQPILPTIPKTKCSEYNQTFEENNNNNN